MREISGKPSRVSAWHLNAPTLRCHPKAPSLSLDVHMRAAAPAIITDHSLPPTNRPQKPTSAAMPGAMQPLSVGKRGRDMWKYWEAGGSRRRLRMTDVTFRMRSTWLYVLPTA